MLQLDFNHLLARKSFVEMFEKKLLYLAKIHRYSHGFVTITFLALIFLLINSI